MSKDLAILVNPDTPLFEAATKLFLSKKLFHIEYIWLFCFGWSTLSSKYCLLFGTKFTESLWFTVLSWPDPHFVFVNCELFIKFEISNLWLSISCGNAEMFVESTPIELFDSFLYDGVSVSKLELDSISIVSACSSSSICKILTFLMMPL